MADASEKQREKSDSEESSTSSSGDAGSSESEHDAATVLVQMASTPPRQGKNDAKSKEEENASDEPPAKKSKPEPDPLATRTGGAYIPPAKLRMMQQQIEDKSSAAYQRIAWEALKKSINGLINKVNTSNVAVIVQELIQENIIRGRGLLVRSLLQAQAASTTFTNVYAGLVSVVNTKFPQNGELLLRRLIYQFRRSFRRNNKPLCLSSATFIAHLVNQQVAHEVLALELLTLLLETPTDDSVEIAVAFLKECGLKLTEVTSRGVHFVFERIRGILTEATIDKRVQYMIDVLFAVRKDKYKDYPAVISELDLVEESEQVTHLLTLEDDGDPEDHLNVFKFDPEYLENEEKYKTIKADILGEGASDESGSGEESEEEDDDDEEQTTEITDATQTNIMGLRRTVYLTIMSSVDYEECAHKMVKMQLKPGQEGEVCFMIIECCSQERSFLKFYGLLAERFCRIDKSYEEQFTACFQEQYETIHRLETNKLRNIAKLFAHLFYTDAIPWTCLVCVHLNEDETTSSSRIFIKILFQEIAEFLGLPKLNERLKDPTLSAYFEGLLPRDNPRNTRFSINFFTSIGLGGLTDELREHLKSAPKMIMSQQRNVESSDSSSGSGSSGSDSSSSDDSDSDSDGSEEDRRRHQIERGRRHRPEASTRSRNDREEERRREHHRDDRRGRDDDRARREGTRDERRSNNKDRSERDSPRRDRRERERDDRRRDEKRGRERRRGDSDERTERRDTRYGRGRDD